MAQRLEAKAPRKPAASASKSRETRKSASATPKSRKRTSELSVSSETASGALPIEELRFLDTTTLIELHRAVASDFSDSRSRPGEVDSALALTTVVDRPKAKVMGQEAYPAFSDKAAALVFGILQKRPFPSCNRRVALVALFVFAALNGRKLNTSSVSEKDLESLLRRASSGDRAETDAATWFGEIRAALARMLT